jgi:hypothetical protein
LEEEDRRKAEEEQNYDQDDFAYPWLNSIFKKVLNDELCAKRPAYTWGVLHGVHLAKAIGITRVSVIEFGVAGGNGLVSLERIAERVEENFKVGVDVYGFDVGTGLPKPQEYRDLPNLYIKGAFLMDFEKLKKRLKKAQLIMGLVENTVQKFIDSAPASIAFVSFDLDYYSSTLEAFRVLEAYQASLLPRVHCYFDDIMGFTFSDYNGERLAISEFNKSHSMRKISPIYGLKYFLPPPHTIEQACWSEHFYMAHIFDHNLYGLSDGLTKRSSGGFSDLKDE